MVKSKDNSSKQSKSAQQAHEAVEVVQADIQLQDQLQALRNEPSNNQQKKPMSRKALVSISVVGGVLLLVFGMVIGIVIGSNASKDSRRNDDNCYYPDYPMMRGYYQDPCGRGSIYNYREGSSDASKPSDTTKTEENN